MKLPKNSIKLLHEFVIAKTVVFLEIAKETDKFTDICSTLVDFVMSFQGIGITYHYVVNSSNRTDAIKFYHFDKTLIFEVKFSYDVTNKIVDYNINISNTYNVESYVFGLLLSIFGHKCAGGTEQLFELQYILKKLPIKYSVMRNIMCSDDNATRHLTEQLGYYAHAAEMYVYAWNSALRMRNIELPMHEVQNSFNEAISLA